MGIFKNLAFQRIGKFRGQVSAAIGLIALIDIFLGKAHPIDLLNLIFSGRLLVCWGLILAGVTFRIWAAGNLNANEELISRGPYRMLRHPLYLGTALVYLAFFLGFGDDLLGAVLFLAVIFIVYYPRMLQEEDSLAKKFPQEFKRYEKLPRLMPNLLLLGAALKNDSFSLKKAYKNRGIGSLWALLLLPLFFKAVVIIKRHL